MEKLAGRKRKFFGAGGFVFLFRGGSPAMVLLFTVLTLFAASGTLFATTPTSLNITTVSGSCDDLTVKVRLTDNATNPISGATVNCTIAAGDKVFASVNARTDDGGNATCNLSETNLEDWAPKFKMSVYEDAQGKHVTYYSDNFTVKVVYDGNGTYARSYIETGPLNVFQYVWNFEGDILNEQAENTTTTSFSSHLYERGCPKYAWPRVKVKCGSSESNWSAPGFLQIPPGDDDIFITRASVKTDVYNYPEYQNGKIFVDVDFSNATVARTVEVLKPFAFGGDDGRVEVEYEMHEGEDSYYYCGYNDYRNVIRPYGFTINATDLQNLDLIGFDSTCVVHHACDDIFINQNTIETCAIPVQKYEVAIVDTDNDGKYERIAIRNHAGFGSVSPGSDMKSDVHVFIRSDSGNYPCVTEFVLDDKNVTSVKYSSENVLWIDINETDRSILKQPLIIMISSQSYNQLNFSLQTPDFARVSYFDGSLRPVINDARHVGCTIRVNISGNLNIESLNSTNPAQDFNVTKDGEDVSNSIKFKGVTQGGNGTMVYLVDADGCFDGDGYKIGFVQENAVNATYGAAPKIGASCNYGVIFWGDAHEVPASLFDLSNDIAMGNNDTTMHTVNGTAEVHPAVEVFGVDWDDDERIDSVVFYTGSADKKFVGFNCPSCTANVTSWSFWGNLATLFDVQQDKVGLDPLGNHYIVPLGETRLERYSYGYSNNVTYDEQDLILEIRLDNTGVTLDGQSLEGTYVVTNFYKTIWEGMAANYDQNTFTLDIKLNGRKYKRWNCPYGATNCWEPYEDNVSYIIDPNADDDFFGRDFEVMAGSWNCTEGSYWHDQYGNVTITLWDDPYLHSDTLFLSFLPENGFRYERLGVPLGTGAPVGTGFVLEGGRESDLYVMDVTGTLRGFWDQPMNGVEVQAWVLMKYPKNAVVIDNWEGKKYVFAPEDGNWSAPGFNWVGRAFWEMKPMTVYLKISKGVPVIIEDTAQLAPGQWKAVALTFDPVTSEIMYGDQAIGHVPFIWAPRTMQCNGSTEYYCSAGPSGRATTDENGHFLIHIVSHVSNGEPVVFTVDGLPVNNIVAGDKLLEFNAVYNQSTGSAKVFDLSLADAQRLPVTQLENNVMILSFPVKKAYYVGDASVLPEYVSTWPQFSIPRTCEAVVEIVYTYDSRFPAVCWHTPYAAVSADGTGVHSYVADFPGDIKAVIGGHAFMEQAFYNVDVEKFMIGEALSTPDSLTLTGNGENQGWYILYNWTGASVSDIINSDGIDYLIYPSGPGYRSTDGTNGDLPLDLVPQGGVIVHVTGNGATWPVN